MLNKELLQIKGTVVPLGSHKRGGATTRRRGLGRDQVCVPIAISRAGGFVGKVSNFGTPNRQDLANVLSGRFTSSEVVVTDGGRPYQRVAREENITLVQNPRELQDLRRKVRTTQEAMENQEAWLEKYPDESERMENILSRLIEIKKLANAYVTDLKRDLNTGKLKYSPEGKTVLRSLFIGDKALYPINIKPILKANNITRAFKQTFVSEYELNWLWLCLNHYYGIRTDDDFAYAILERAGINLDVSAYLKPAVVKEVIDTQAGEAYLDKYFPAPKVFSSIPQKYIDAYMSLLLLYCEMDYGGSFGGTPKYADKMYKYCFNIISNDRKRMKMWREVIALVRI